MWRRGLLSQDQLGYWFRVEYRCPVSQRYLKLYLSVELLSGHTETFPMIPHHKTWPLESSHFLLHGVLTRHYLRPPWTHQKRFIKNSEDLHLILQSPGHSNSKIQTHWSSHCAFAYLRVGHDEHCVFFCSGSTDSFVWGDKGREARATIITSSLGEYFCILLYSDTRILHLIASGIKLCRSFLKNHSGIRRKLRIVDCAVEAH